MLTTRLRGWKNWLADLKVLSPQERVWKLAVDAKRRAYRQLERSLAAQGKELFVLQQRVLECKNICHAAQAELHEYDINMERKLLLSESVSAQSFLDYRAWRLQIEERIKTAEQDQERAEQAVCEKQRVIDKVRQDIARLDGQIQMCQERVDKLMRKREEASNERAEEESAELMMMRSTKRTYVPN